jgi:hypothetical protein
MRTINRNLDIHNNARPHTAEETTKLLEKFG